VTEQRSMLAYGHPRPRKGKRFIIAGSCLMVVGVLMGVIGASIFVLPTMPPRPIYWLGFVCFWGFLPTGVLAVALLVIGLIRMNTRQDDRAGDFRHV
jgi:hypothetical protein